MDDEGEVIDVPIQRRRDTGAALRLLARLMHNQPVEPQTITIDGPAPYGGRAIVRETRQTPGKTSAIGMDSGSM